MVGCCFAHVLTLCRDRTLKIKLVQWGFMKEILPADWDALLVLYKRRLLEGKRSTEFMIHGERKTLYDLQRHMRARSSFQTKFLASTEMGAQIPSYIRCYTPEPAGETEDPWTSSSLLTSASVMSSSSTVISIDPAIYLSHSFQETPHFHQSPNDIDWLLQETSSSNCKSKLGDVSVPNMKIDWV